jgi:glycyl-tRNA synthetase
VGINRLALMVLCDSYWEDAERERTVLRLKPALAPYEVAVFPLLRNKPELVTTARSIYDDLLDDHRVAWDDRGNIGKRYLAQDEIGTPFCITVDYQTLTEQTVTVRQRDTATQERIATAQLRGYLREQVRK